jgi:hypothetical protein
VNDVSGRSSTPSPVSLWRSAECGRECSVATGLELKMADLTLLLSEMVGPESKMADVTYALH